MLRKQFEKKKFIISKDNSREIFWENSLRKIFKARRAKGRREDGQGNIPPRKANGRGKAAMHRQEKLQDYFWMKWLIGTND